MAVGFSSLTTSSSDFMGGCSWANLSFSWVKLSRPWRGGEDMKPFLKQQAAQDCFCCSGLTAKDINNLILAEKRKSGRENRLFWRHYRWIIEREAKKSKKVGKRWQGRHWRGEWGRREEWHVCVGQDGFATSVLIHLLEGFVLLFQGKNFVIPIDEPCQSFMMPNLFSAFQHLLILLKP